MIGSLKLAIISMFTTLFVLAQAYCACAIPIDVKLDSLPMHEMDHHDHSAMSKSSVTQTPDKNNHPCQHCEQGLDKATPSISSVAITAPVFAVQHSNTPLAKPFEGTLYVTVDKTLDRHAWLDPPPSLISTPITLKTRLLTWYFASAFNPRACLPRIILIGDHYV